MMDVTQGQTPRDAGDDIAVGSTDRLTCSCCDGHLVWHQPVPWRPDRLLGTCSECGGWHVLEGSDGQDGVVVPVGGTFTEGSADRDRTR